MALRALPLPSPPSRPGRALGCREGARTGRCGWSCATGLALPEGASRAAGSARASEVGHPASPPWRSPRQAVRAVPRRARRLWPCATEAPPPPRLSARPSPPGRAECLRTAVSALSAPGPRPRGRVAAYVREAKPRRRRGKGRKKKRHEGGRGKTLFLFLLQALKRGAGDSASARFRESPRRHLCLLRRTGAGPRRPDGAAGMWDPQEFERHWQAEFPGEEAPVMRLESVPDMERELERCKLNLKRLQQVLAEEKFKVWYLQAALNGEKVDLRDGRPEGGDAGGCGGGGDSSSRGASVEEQEPAGPLRAPPLRDEAGAAGRDPDPPGPEVATPAEPAPYVCLDLPAWPGAMEGGGAVRSLTAAIHQQLVQPRLLFGLREDCAPPGRDGAGSSAPGEERSSGTHAGRGSEEGEPDASGGDDGGDGSDHDFEMVDLNEKFVLGHLLVAPYRFGTRDEGEKPARPCSPHRWMHLIPGGWRHHRRSRDLEQLEAEDEPPRRGAREHLAQWGRKRFLRVPDRDSPSHSSPERGSDCSHNSSDHEDGFSAGRRTPSLGTRACKVTLGFG